MNSDWTHINNDKRFNDKWFTYKIKIEYYRNYKNIGLKLPENWFDD